MADFDQLMKLLQAGEQSEFAPVIAAHSVKIAGKAASAIHSAQQESIETFEKVEDRFIEKKVPKSSKFRQDFEDAASITMLAQARMQESVGDVLAAIAQQVKRA